MREICWHKAGFDDNRGGKATPVCPSEGRLPRIFDNIESGLLPALRQTLQISERGDFCVGFFNLRGWKSIDDLISAWPGGESGQCRLLVGMQRLPQDELRAALSAGQEEAALDNQTAL